MLLRSHHSCIGNGPIESFSISVDQSRCREAIAVQEQNPLRLRLKRTQVASRCRTSLRTEENTHRQARGKLGRDFYWRMGKIVYEQDLRRTVLREKDLQTCFEQARHTYLIVFHRHHDRQVREGQLAWSQSIPTRSRRNGKRCEQCHRFTCFSTLALAPSTDEAIATHGPVRGVHIIAWT